jgi:hypothetical protein
MTKPADLTDALDQLAAVVDLLRACEMACATLQPDDAEPILAVVAAALEKLAAVKAMIEAGR